MQAIITKVVSFILSLLMPVTGLFAGGTPVNSGDILVIQGGWATDTSNGYQLITTYEDFQACFGERTAEESKANAFLSSIDESYFENGNLAVINVTLADTAETVVVTSATEKEDTLEVSYIVEETAAFGATMICYAAICVKTSKSITQVEAEEKDGFSVIYRSVMGYLIDAVK